LRYQIKILFHPICLSFKPKRIVYKRLILEVQIHSQRTRILIISEVSY
jgi:hypothetical protein